jgi:hypothetical protein
MALPVDHLDRDSLRWLAERARERAAIERGSSKHSNADQRARVFEALSDAAFSCESMLTRDTYYEMWGDPPATQDVRPEDRGETTR